MNYIEQINNFWSHTEEMDLSSTDISVYFSLLKYNNQLNWITSFRCDYAVICQYSRVSKNSFYKSINNLSNLNLITYEKGERNVLKPKIVVLKLKNRKGTIKEQNEEQNEEQKGNLYKLLNKETIKLINKNYGVVNKNLKNWIEETKKPIVDETIPTFEDFKKYAIEKKPKVDLESVKFKYESWKANDWKNGNDKKIKNWKSTLLNTLPYIKEIDKTQQSTSVLTQTPIER